MIFNARKLPLQDVDLQTVYQLSARNNLEVEASHLLQASAASVFNFSSLPVSRVIGRH